ncbi:hypothetical protein ACI79D_00715 [Geodermatophilus sp. SYSU D00708]
MLLAKKVVSSLGVVAATAGLWAFATLGAFGDGNDPFPHSVSGEVAVVVPGG